MSVLGFVVPCVLFKLNVRQTNKVKCVLRLIKQNTKRNARHEFQGEDVQEVRLEDYKIEKLVHL